MAKIIRTFALAYIAVIAIFIAYLGFAWSFIPSSRMANLGITVENISGINTLKSIMGAGLLSTSALCFLYIRNQKSWFKPLLIFTTAIFIIRTISLITDGFDERMAIFASLEGLILVALITSYRFRPSDV